MEIEYADNLTLTEQIGPITTQHLVADGSTRASIVRGVEAFGANRWQKQCALMAGDLLALGASLSVTLAVSVMIRELIDIDEVLPHRLVSSDMLIARVLVPAATLLWFSNMWGHYSRIKPFWTEARELSKITLYACALSAVILVLTQSVVPRLWLVFSGVFLLFLAPLFRCLAKSLLASAGRWFVPLVVVGEPDQLRVAQKAIESDRSLGYQVAVKVEIDRHSILSEEQRNGIVDLINRLGSRYSRPRLMFAFERNQLLDRQQSLVDDLSSTFEHVIVGRPMQGLSGVNAEVLAIDRHDTLFLRLSSGGIDPLGQFIKRCVDIIGAVLALLLLLPLLANVTLKVRSDGGAVLFGSERIGRHGRRFQCLKFRTMHSDARDRLKALLDTDLTAREEWTTNFKLKCDPRITPLGTLLRRTSLDELPQLWNVLRGDMSLVGPRPILPEEAMTYGDPALKVYEGVRPGLTGLWQISGRSNLPYDERVALNQWYVRNWSFWLDVSIVLRTLPALFGHDEAY